MLYTEAQKLFERRRKGYSYKKLFHNGRLEMDGGRFIFSLDYTSSRPLLALSPDNNVEALNEFPQSSISDKLFVEKVLGGVCVSSKRSLTRHVHTLRLIRYRGEKFDVPYTKGLVYNTFTHKVVRCAEDVIKATDRKASQQIYAHVNRAMDMMTVLQRLSDWPKDAHELRPKGYSWQVCGAMLGKCESYALDDTSLAEMAEAAYLAGVVAAGYAERRGWVYDASGQNGRFVEKTESEWWPTHYEKIRRAAKRKLTQKLKDYYDTYRKEVITHTPEQPLPLAA